MTSLRKLLFVILVALLAAACTAALADTEYSLSPAPAVVRLKDNRTVVTAETLGDHPELLTVIGMSKEDTLADWESRGVVFQAWSEINPKTWSASKSKYTCLEICVLQDGDASQFPDMIHAEDRTVWASYEESCKANLSALGYTFQAMEKPQKSAEGNRYLLLLYKRTTDSGEYRGYMARTVFNGYTIVFDLKAYNQKPVPGTHDNELYRVIKTLADSGTAGLPAVSGETPDGTADISSGEGTENDDGTGTANYDGTGRLDITVGPPRETNTNTFTVEGVTAPGAQVIGVMMKSVGDPMPQRFETTAHAKNGSFKLKMTIPESEESVWLMTLNVYESAESNTIIADKVFDFTTYKKTLIPCELDEPVPEKIYADELVIQGTTMKAVEVQCIATNSAGQTVFSPNPIHPNGTGRFTFKIQLDDEDVYSISLVITKKGYDVNRQSFTVQRFLTDEARQDQIRKKAEKNLGYGTFRSRIEQYVGKITKFNVWITAIDQIGDEWRITAAGAKTGDHYSQLLMYFTQEEPPFSVDAEKKLTLYGKCIGLYQIQSEESVESIPSLDLLLFD